VSPVVGDVDHELGRVAGTGKDVNLEGHSRTDAEAQGGTALVAACACDLPERLVRRYVGHLGAVGRREGGLAGGIVVAG
jgi:hypothetical protein